MTFTSYYRKGISLLKSLTQKGFFHIFIGNTLVKFVSLCSAVFLPRILVPESLYGMLSTVDNVNSYLILINGFGLANSILRFCSMRETQEEKSAIFAFCLKGGLIADALIMCVYLPLLFTGVLGNNNYGVAKPYIIIACLIPVLTYLQEVFLLYFRSNLMNRVYSRVSVLYTVLYAAFQILLALAFSIRGVFVGRYIALGLIVLLCFLYTRKTGIIKQNAPSLTIREKKEILWFGFGAMIANAFSLVMPLNETLVVNLVMKDFSMTAYYKAASMIPSNLQFIATSVVVFIFPYFAKHSGDGRWIQKNILRLLVGMVCLMVPIMLIGYVCSPWIISIIYGKDYAPAIAIMKPMWIAFGINSILRVPLGNALAALGEIRFNIILSVIISLLHFALDYVFISRFGLTGASYALMISYTVSSVASLAYCLIMCKRKWMEKEEA